MKLITQPEGSRCCGQACVAMIAGVSLDYAIRCFRTSGPTRTRKVAAVLRVLGYRCDGRLTRGRIPAGRGTYLVKMVIEERWGSVVGGSIIVRKALHWVVIKDGAIYDPADRDEAESPEHWASARMTSYMRVKRG